MIVLDFPQGSEEWLRARLGEVGASRVADVVARTKTGYGASRANYAAELVAERLTGVPAERYVNSAMQWGTDHEAEARSLYEFMTDSIVTPIGLVLHPTINMSAASPDGLVGKANGLEIKCPSTSTHLATLLDETIDGKYMKQMQWQMSCTGGEWTDFCSYDPRMPADMQLWIKRVPRDEGMIAELEKEVRIFLSEIDDTIERLTAKFRKEAA